MSAPHRTLRGDITTLRRRYASEISFVAGLATAAFCSGSIVALTIALSWIN